MPNRLNLSVNKILNTYFLFFFDIQLQQTFGIFMAIFHVLLIKVFELSFFIV